MIRYLPLRDWSAPVAPIDPPFDKLDQLGWLPLADSELLLCAHYCAIGVRLDGQHPMVGIVTHTDILARSLIANDANWTAAYMPISLRCFPFRLQGPPGDDPLAGLELAAVKPLSEKPRLLRLRDEQGGPSKELLSIHDGLKNVWESQQRWQAALELLLIADVLVPIKRQADAAPRSGLHTVDRRRFVQLSKTALEAMTRHSFAAIDLVTAMTFSQIHLRPEFRPQASAVATPADGQAAADAGLGGGLETITPWLDTSELFPGAWAADPLNWRAAPPQSGGGS